MLNSEQVKRLKVIRADHPRSSEECCTAMFDYWLQVDTNASWDKLITALQSVQHEVLAAKIIRLLTSECKLIFERLVLYVCGNQMT